MSRDYLNQPPTSVRRTDRQVHDEAWIDDMLTRAAVGVLASVHDGQPYLNSNIYAYDAERNCIYLHTANVGRTVANLEAHPQVCFSVMELGRLLPAPEALEFSLEYASVVVFGTVTRITEENEALGALQRIMDKYAPHLQPTQDYRPPVVEELKRTAVLRLDISARSGKKKEVGDFEGAYWFQEQPMLASTRARHTPDEAR